MSVAPDPAGGRALIVGSDEPEVRARTESLRADLAAAGWYPVAHLDDVGDQSHVAMIGVGDGSEAIRRSATDARVASVVLVDAMVTTADIELIDEASDLGVLTVIDPARRDRLRAAVDAHLGSAHEDSELHVVPWDDAIGSDIVVPWLARRAQSAPVHREIVVVTPDGWELHADLHTPGRATPGPGVVLMHSGRSDRVVLARLAVLLARRGVHAVNLDWRGRGRSTNRGRFIDFTPAQQDEVRHDVTASYDALAELEMVDPDRLGVLGIAHGARYGAAGALGDPRTKALAVLTGFHMADESQRRALASGHVEVLFVTGAQHRMASEAMRALYALVPGRRSRFVEYPEGVLGYQLFDLHPDLEPMIADWFAEVLGA